MPNPSSQQDRPRKLEVTYPRISPLSLHHEHQLPTSFHNFSDFMSGPALPPAYRLPHPLRRPIYNSLVPDIKLAKRRPWQASTGTDQRARVISRLYSHPSPRPHRGALRSHRFDDAMFLPPLPPRPRTRHESLPHDPSPEKRLPRPHCLCPPAQFRPGRTSGFSHRRR